MKKLFLVALLSLMLLVTKGVYAESLTVTATVDTLFILDGYTAPNSLVTFSENSAVIGTTTSDNSGHFIKEFNNQSSGIHTVEIYSTNPDNITTQTVSYDFLLLVNQSLTLSDIYLPPSISIPQSAFYDNQSIVVSGYSVPSSLIKIEVTGPTSKTDYVTSGANGYYSDSIEANLLGLGDSQVKATLDIISVTSTTSNSITFTISASAIPTPTSGFTTSSQTGSPTTSNPTLSPTPAAAFSDNEPAIIACPYPYPNLCFFDLEKAGYFEADKLSFFNYIVAFVKNFGKPELIATDINEDQVVDSIDLSIIFYYVKSKTDRILGISVNENARPAILGLYSQAVDFPFTIINNKFMELINNPSIRLIFNLIVLETVVGVPFFLVFLFLIASTKRNARE